MNRTVQVKPDGTWRIDNIPANFGLVRARATCIGNNVTKSGQSGLINIQQGIINGFDSDIILGEVDPIPQSLTFSATASTLNSVAANAQLSVIANFADGGMKNVTMGSSGTIYSTSNANVASVSTDGLVTAISSGTVIVSATNEGALGLIQIRVLLAGDTDNDGIPDDVELANGLDPNNPIDGMEDYDGDGLTNKQELVDYGTNIHTADTDGDTILDGEEVIAGTDGFVTSPLLADTDGDGIRDALEISSGSDPTNPASYDLSRSLASVEVTPAVFLLTYNTIIGEASKQLSVIGHLLDGTTIDLTSSVKGTNYTSSNLSVCNFGSPDGKVFAGTSGGCTITATNSGFSDTTLGTVRTFSPIPLNYVSIPTTGFANNVDVIGNYAYVAAGAIGLVVVDVSNHSLPKIVATVDTPGNANDVKVMGNTLFLADGVSGLRIMDVTNPLSPTLIGSLDTPGNAWDVAVQDNLAFVADDTAGLQVINVSNLSSPVIMASVDTPGVAKGVDLARPDRSIAVVADGTSGLQVIDYSNVASPVITGTAYVAGMDSRDVVISGDYAFVADFNKSFTSVDITNPYGPVIRASTPQSTGGLLMDAAVNGRFAFGADVFFVNGVPIIDVSTPQTPVPRATLNFANFRDDNGTGIAVDGNYVYLTAARTITENGASGDTRLYVGQYLAIEDTTGIPPSVAITSPTNGQTVVQGTSVTITASASDNIGVAAVHFLINGQIVFSDTTSPYQFNYTVPSGVTQLAISSIAVDAGSNISESPAVTVNVSPAPVMGMSTHPKLEKD